MSYSNKVVVGISSRSSQRDLEWLMDFIRRTFRTVVSDVRYLPITNKNGVEWESEVRRCSVGILYHTKHQGRLNIVDVDGALYNAELQSLYHILGKSRVLVVLDDLENCPDSEKQRILDAQPSLRRYSSQLLLFPEKNKEGKAYERKEEFLKIIGNNVAPRVSQVNPTKSIGSYLPSIPLSLPAFLTSSKSSETSSHSKQRDVAQCKPPKNSSLKISIFSRSAPTNYEWLMGWLKRNIMRSDDIRAVQITNNSTNFYSELVDCSFAILYHTQNQGRLNITDVTDALYNDELKELSNRLGKDNVIVVIDDLQNTETTERNRILEGQPSIGRLARDLYLFHKEMKNTENLEHIKQIIVRKMQKNEVMNPDYRQAMPERKSDTCSKEQEFYSPPGSSYSDPNDSGEPKTKRFLAELERTFQDARSFLDTAATKFEDYKKAFQADYRAFEQETQMLREQKKELQRTNSNLLKERREKEDVQKQLLEANSKIIQEKQRTIERLREDLETQITREKFQKDQWEKANEESHGRIQKLEEEIQKLQNYIQEMEGKSKEEQAGQNWRYGIKKRESQQYEERSPISGPEDDEMTPCEHRNCSGDAKHEDAHWDRTQRHLDTVCNQWQNPTEIQSLTLADNQIKQLRCTIQEKDEEIRRLKSELEESAKIMDDILTGSGGRKEKATSGSGSQPHGHHHREF